MLRLFHTHMAIFPDSACLSSFANGVDGEIRDVPTGWGSRFCGLMKGGVVEMKGFEGGLFC